MYRFNMYRPTELNKEDMNEGNGSKSGKNRKQNVNIFKIISARVSTSNIPDLPLHFPSACKIYHLSARPTCNYFSYP